MVIQIIDENRKPSLGQKLSKGFGEALKGAQQYMTQQAKVSAIKSAGLPEGYELLPEQAQAAIAKKTFAGPESAKDKSIRLLNEAKTKAAEQKTDYYKDYQKMANELSGGMNVDNGNNFTNQIMQEPQEQRPQDFDLATDEYQPKEQPKVNRVEDIKKKKEQLTKLAGFKGKEGPIGVKGNIAQAELDRMEKEEKKEQDLKKLARKEFEGERSFHTGYSKKIEEQADQMRESIPKKGMALDFSRNSVESGDVSYFSPDKLADATGVDLFRTAKGAQLLTAGKENLLSNMSKVGAKAQNIWFEQRLNSMFPKIGQSKEANLTTQEMLEGELAMDKAYLDAFDRLVEEDEAKYGYTRKDIQKRAQQEADPIQRQILKRSSYRMKELEEQEMGLDKLKNKVGKDTPKGTPFTLAMAQLYYEKFGDKGMKVAEKNGYYIPAIEEYETYRRAPQEFREGLSQ